MKRSPPAAGFSLLEVLLVVALVGIMAAAVIPNAASNPYESLTSAGQMLAADLAYARSLAVVNNDRYQLQFDRSNNLYKLVYSGTNPALTAIPPSPFQSPEDSAGSYVVRLGNLPRISGSAVALYDVQLVASQPTETTTIEFGPLGATTATQPTEIWFSTGSGQAARFIGLTVNPATGLASVGSFSASAPSGASGSSTTGSSTGGSSTTGSSSNTNTGVSVDVGGLNINLNLNILP
jgi:prepilin-type N-terminal cleavage/methylation domain-containing protein